jgi:hypothetical protein
MSQKSLMYLRNSACTGYRRASPVPSLLGKKGKSEKLVVSLGVLSRQEA